MTIIKQAKNIHITVKKAEIIIAENLTMTAKKVIIEATNDNLEFNGSKKIKVDGN
jgi:phage gp45-like